MPEELCPGLISRPPNPLCASCAWHESAGRRQPEATQAATGWTCPNHEPACAGRLSPVNPARPLPLCRRCQRYRYAAGAMRPAATHDGHTWLCAHVIPIREEPARAGPT